jgi:hypothetical protein
MSLLIFKNTSSLFTFSQMIIYALAKLLEELVIVKNRVMRIPYSEYQDWKID